MAEQPTPDNARSDEGQGRDVIAVARDIAILLAFFVYVVGFASHLTFLDRVGFGHDFAVGSIYDLISWTGDAVTFGWWLILLALIPFALLLVLASFLRTRDFGSVRVGRICVAAMVGIALVFGYSTSYLAGVSIGVTEFRGATGQQDGKNPYGPQILLQRANSTVAEAPCARTNGPLRASEEQYYLMAETADTFQIIQHSTKGRHPMPMGFRKQTIDCYVIVPQDNVAASSIATPSPSATPASGVQTPPPPPSMVGVNLRSSPSQSNSITRASQQSSAF